MPRLPKYVRITEAPDGSVRRVEKGGREIHGLHYRRTTRKDAKPERGVYYTYRDGSRHDLGSDLADAARVVENRPEPIPAWADPPIPGFDGAEPAPSKEKLSDCIRFWQEWKAEQGRRGSYVDETVRCFNELISVAGDKPVNQLTKDDFVRFERYLNRESRKHDGNDWHNRRIKSVRAVLNHVWRKTEYPLPDAWAKWFGDIERLPSKPANRSKRGFPPALLRAVLAVCDEDAAIDVEAMPTATNSDNGKLSQALERKRSGVQFRAITVLAINCGLGNQDSCDIEWSHVRLTGKFPHIDFPRTKADWRTGTPVDRKTPLLPETVRALKAWREYEKLNGFVFRDKNKGQWTYDDISAAFGKLVKRSGYDDAQAWSFRHLRKSPGKAARDAGLPDWMVQALLGHVIDTVAARHYIEDPKPGHLGPIVRAIRRMYFTGAT